MQRDSLRRMLERTPDPAFALTTFGELWAWNAAAEALTGFPAADVLNRPFATLTDARDPLGKPIDDEYCARVIRDGGSASFDIELRAADGRLIWLNVSVLVFEPLRASPALVVHLAHDITASRKRRLLYERLVGSAREIVQLADEEHHLVPVSPLTEQERRILQLFANGHTPSQVARDLDIAAQTLRNHLYNVNKKLGTRDRLEAVTHAVRRGLI
ncbi:MAG TPA: LuxR C-terminal-related transcriptional regulator [Gemmatimonadaceae bacterium]